MCRSLCRAVGRYSTAIVVAMVSAATASPGQSTSAAGASDTVLSIEKPRNPLPAEAASAKVSRFSFIAYGDTRGRRDGVNEQYEHGLVVESMLRTIKSMESGPEPVRFVLQSGDAVVNGRDPKQWNVSFIGLINRLTTTGGVPYYLAPGNHDVTSAAELSAPGRLVGLQNYLRAMGQLIPADGATRRLTGYPTYAFGYGNTFVIAFDSNIAEDSTQLAWVRAQLEGLDRKRYTHVVAFFHHPAYSSGPHGGSTIERPTMAVRAHYMPLFRKHHVQLLFTGHEHFFEHFVERYRDVAGVPRRIDHIVSGGGGAPLYTYQGEPDLGAYMRSSGVDSARVTHLVRPGSKAGDNPYHFTVVHVDGERVWLEVVGVDWGAGYAPYQGNRSILGDTLGRRD
ncbi:metallophosphoesterase [Gemmatimonas sp.]|uniref:metallophosphoesterase family protein n=1 Tax=Gemmatimonas sp. TaxID=1962908 RepID=UPI00286DED2B|nr:metallophosphoesterase [Gemmatimonas sp.]